mgnify:FL=1
MGRWAKKQSPEHQTDFFGFFNLATDPTETQNLGVAAAEVLAGEVAAALARDRHDGNARASAAQQGMSHELGYTGGDDDGKE